VLATLVLTAGVFRFFTNRITGSSPSQSCPLSMAVMQPQSIYWVCDAVAAKSGTNSSEAYQLYLEGRYYGQKQNAEGNRRWVTISNRPSRSIRNYAPAYAGLADYYGRLAGGGTSGAEYWPKSEEAAVKALALDESSGEAHEALALVRMWYDRNWRGTESELKRALELKPEFAETYTFYARLLEAMGTVRRSRRGGQAIV
jgi:tetratricopeptide (TPR) repeat protein